MAAKGYQGYPQTPAPQSQVTIVNTTTPLAAPQTSTSDSRNQRFKVSAGKVTGSLQIVCGCLSMILSLVALYIALDSEISRFQNVRSGIDRVYHDGASHVFSFVAWPFWAGLCFYLVTGIIGLHTVNRTKCKIIGYMVMSIIASVIAGGHVIWESIGAAIGGTCYGYRTATFDYNDDFYNNGGRLRYTYHHACDLDGLRICHGLAALVGFAEMVIAIVSAAFCCHGVCCGNSATSSSDAQATVVQYINQPQQHVPEQQPPGYQDLVH